MVHFHVSNEMTEYDVRNYLTKIYKLPVVAVKVELKNGNVVRSQKGFILKEDDYKVAYVQMEKNFKFNFPDIPKIPGRDIYDKTVERNKKANEELQEKYPYRPGLPNWFLQ